MSEIRTGYSFDDVLLVPRFSDLNSRSETDVSSCKYDLPIVMSPMDTITTQDMIRCFVERNLMATVHRYFKTPQEQFEFVNELGHSSRCSVPYYIMTYFAIGSIKKHKEWIDYLLEKGVTKFLIDMAHSHCRLGIDTIKYIKNINCEYKIIIGNVATASGFHDLQKAGADFIRVGIGNGQACETRNNTGFGVPQFTAIQDCATIKKHTKLIADGGIKHNGDIAKAMAGGADLVMLGKMLAGTDLAAGLNYTKDKEYVLGLDAEDIFYKEYRGMASREAREGILNYGSVEGVSGLVKYTGKTVDLLNDIKLNLQASLSYNGSNNWEYFKKNIKYIIVSTNTIRENATNLINI